MRTADSLVRVAVLGAGTMGHGIAQVCAEAGLQVALFDLGPEPLEKGMLAVRRMLDRGVAKGKFDAAHAEATLQRIVPHTDLVAACGGADLVIEAVPEQLELKRRIFAQVEAAVADDGWLATNTSSLSIDRIAEGLRAPGRFLGLHFFNPVPIMALLEIVVGTHTDAAFVDQAVAFGKRLGKEPITVKDTPGFASSRLGIAIAMEAIRMVEAGVASAEDIDRAMELGYRHPMGPLRLTDLVGLDVRLGIADSLCEALGERFRPPELLRRMVADGRLGKKSGRGFYDWTE
ncbi:MAG TPA: 3-hydroxyacyl-CoA dehydrogenase family protein [Planctomycetota bacterium]